MTKDEVEARCDCPCFVFSREEHQRILDGDVVVKERDGETYPFHDGSYSVTRLMDRYDATNAPHSGTWDELEPGDYKNWGWVAVLLEGKYNVPY